MKREDVKAKLPGITDEQLNWLMSENGADINREKTVAEQFKTQFEHAQAQLKTAQDGLAKFDGKKTPDEYEAELTKLRGDMQAQADGFAFDSALNTAIMGKKGRSVKAVRALLDVDALKSSKDRTTDIDKALEEAAKANPLGFRRGHRGRQRPRFQRRRARHSAHRRHRCCHRSLQGNEPRHQDRLIERKYYGTRSTGSLFQAG